MAYWLMKSEPDVFSIDDLKRRKTETWDGVRNYQARNFMRAMAKDDQVLFYHSSCTPPGIAGIARIARTAFPDPTQFDPESDYFDPRSNPEDPRWSAVTVRYVRHSKRLLTLDLLRQQEALAEMALLKRGNRLSVMPVSEEEWRCVVGLEGVP